MSDAVDLLDAITEALTGGEHRPGQRDMAAAVESAISNRRHLVVQAGTGTGKSLAYLVPAALSGSKVLIATATKALQDQLIHKDIPLVVAAFAAEERTLTAAVLKGRSNYLCLQRLDEVRESSRQLGFDLLADRAPAAEIHDLAEWAATTPSGDRADLDVEPTWAAWAAVSVSAMECPGAEKCPRGDDCFAERAKRAAEEADLVVVNTFLYGIDLAAEQVILPEHDIVIIDEAHQLEDVVSSTSGLELGAGRFSTLARATQAILDDTLLISRLDAAGDVLTRALAPQVGHRVKRLTDPELVAALEMGRQRAEEVMLALRRIPADVSLDVQTRRDRAVSACGHLVADLSFVREVSSEHVVWVEGTEQQPILRIAPLDVGEVLTSLFGSTTTILTSATIPPLLPQRTALVDHPHDVLDVGSPFDYEFAALLYCAAHLPEPRSPQYTEAMHLELQLLIEAAGGRTLGLFTSYRAMDEAVDALRDRLPGPLLSQRDYPKPRLLEMFAADPATSLFATQSFWQGVDIPGPTLSLVTIDRIPFPRPDEPLHQARREQARQHAFTLIDLPRASTLLAQGVGRLIRRGDDRGVVAILDSRLARAAYRWDLVQALPPMRRTKDQEEVLAVLASLQLAAGVE